MWKIIGGVYKGVCTYSVKDDMYIKSLNADWLIFWGSEGIGWISGNGLVEFLAMYMYIEFLAIYM